MGSSWTVAIINNSGVSYSHPQATGAHGVNLAAPHTALPGELPLGLFPAQNTGENEFQLRSALVCVLNLMLLLNMLRVTKGRHSQAQ